MIVVNIRVKKKVLSFFTTYPERTTYYADSLGGAQSSKYLSTIESNWPDDLMTVYLVHSKNRGILDSLLPKITKMFSPVSILRTHLHHSGKKKKNERAFNNEFQQLQQKFFFRS